MGEIEKKRNSERDLERDLERERVKIKETADKQSQKIYKQIEKITNKKITFLA